MECKNIQSAINRIDRDANENADLLKLLGAQPVVEAPADFDFKLRTRLAQASSPQPENAALLALLSAQPAIDAPADFDFRLRTRLAQSSSPQTENAALLALLSAQPAIDAPADFDFRLRARLARAKSETAAANGLFEKLKIKSLAFTMGQTVAATATLAVVVTVSALHFASGDGEYLKVTVANRQGTEKIALMNQNPGKNARTELAKPAFSARKYREFIPASATTERTADMASGVEAVNAVNDAVTNAINNSIKSINEDWRVFDTEKKEFITTGNRDLIGAENAAPTMSKTVPFVPPSI
jgi:hypothetical protein